MLRPNLNATLSSPFSNASRIARFVSSVYFSSGANGRWALSTKETPTPEPLRRDTFLASRATG